MTGCSSQVSRLRTAILVALSAATGALLTLVVVSSQISSIVEIAAAQSETKMVELQKTVDRYAQEVKTARRRQYELESMQLVVNGTYSSISRSLLSAQKPGAVKTYPHACTPSPVDTKWKHEALKSQCDPKFCKVVKDAEGNILYKLNNSPRKEDGHIDYYPFAWNKATRIESDAVVKRHMESMQRQGKNKGHILSVSGMNYLQMFEEKDSMFTAADYPEVSCEDMPYPDNTFDWVICAGVLEHVQKPWLCTDEFLRILKPGGSIILSIPAVYHEHRHPVDAWRMLSDGMKVLLEGYTDVDIRKVVSHVPFLLHQISHPEDRRSPRMMKLARESMKAINSVEFKDKLWYMTSIAFASKPE